MSDLVSGKTSIARHGALCGGRAFRYVVPDGSGILAHAAYGVAGRQAKRGCHQKSNGSKDAAGSGNHLLHLQKVLPTTNGGAERFQSDVTIAVLCVGSATKGNRPQVFVPRRIVVTTAVTARRYRPCSVQRLKAFCPASADAQVSAWQPIRRKCLAGHQPNNEPA